jgi:hypothetical protein
VPPNMRAIIWKVLGARIEEQPRRAKRRGPPRSPLYLSWIRSLPCLACGSTAQVEAAHMGSDGGMSQKPSDYSCVPYAGTVTQRVRTHIIGSANSLLNAAAA